MGAFQRKRGGGGNEKTPISQIGLEGGGPQKFKLQKCIKWRIVRLKARWWSDCAFLPPPAEPAPAAVELLDISLPGTAPGPAGPAAPRPAPVPPPAPVPVAAGLQAGEGGGLPALGRRPSPGCGRSTCGPRGLTLAWRRRSGDGERPRAPSSQAGKRPPPPPPARHLQGRQGPPEGSPSRARHRGSQHRPAPAPSRVLRWVCKRTPPPRGLPPPVAAGAARDAADSVPSVEGKRGRNE